MLRALGHRARLVIVWLVARHGELCVRAFPRALGVGQPTVSHHLRILRDAGIVGMQCRGHRCYYTLRQDTVKPSCRLWSEHSTCDGSSVVGDVKDNEVPHGCPQPHPGQRLLRFRRPYARPATPRVSDVGLATRQ